MWKKRAFTLIELLVVIAVIALLLAIILPALGLARQKVKMLMCANNQRSVVQGLAVYGAENNSKLPPTPWHAPPLGHYGEPSLLNSHEALTGLFTNPERTFTGRFLSGYLPDVEVFNCTLAPIDADSPWPPETSPRPAKGKYGEFYLNGAYAPLPSTNMLLWNYQGYNHRESTQVDTSLAHFEGPKGLASSNGLVIQDSFYYLTTLGCWLWRAPPGTWRLSHPFKGSSRDMPQYNLIDPDKSVFPDVWMNAGYLDGHVEKFHSTETKHVMNHGWEAWLTRKYK